MHFRYLFDIKFFAVNEMEQLMEGKMKIAM